MENATASESGTKSWRPTPIMKNDGTNTARMQNIERRRAIAVRLHASTTARARETPGSILVWMFSISTVASSTSTPTASARPPSVMMLMVWPVPQSSTTALSSANGMFRTTIKALRQSRRKISTIRPVRTAPSNPSDSRPRMAFETNGDWSNSRRISTSSGTIFLNSGMAALTRLMTSSVEALGHRDVNGAAAVDVRVGGDDVAAVLDRANIAEINGRAGDGTDRSTEQFGQIAAESGIGAGDALQRAGEHVTGGHHQRGLVDRGDGFLRRDLVLLEPVRIESDDDGALRAAEGRRRGDPGQGREHGPHPVEGEVLHLRLAVRRAAEHELPDGHAAGIEACNERRHRAGRHEASGAVDVADGFGHRLAHIRAFMEHQLHERIALNALAFDVVDPRDVKEVILVVIRQIAFHLRRIHAAVRLRDVDGRIADLREDVDGHAPDREHRAQRDGDQRGHDSDGPAERRENELHGPTSVRNGRISPAAVAMPSRARQTFRRERASSISACVSSRSASATSSMLARPAR